MTDWSLKGRRVDKLKDTLEPHFQINKGIYADTTIETLRKKLIEDIEKVTSDEGMAVIERIINKRFGQ